MKDPNEIVKIEKAIAQKYGEEAILNPKHLWNEEKEKEYIEQLKELSKKDNNISERDQKINIDGLFISKKLLTKDSNRTCSVCSAYSFDPKDDLYMNRYECCKKCYVNWVEDREGRWKAGWRPSESEANKK